MTDPYDLALQAASQVWGRGNPATQLERVTRAIVDALADGHFLKIDSRPENGSRRRGRPRAIPEQIRARIRSEHSAGASFNAIAQRLNLEGVPATRGTWHHSSVARIAREGLRAPELPSEG